MENIAFPMPSPIAKTVRKMENSKNTADSFQGVLHKAVNEQNPSEIDDESANDVTTTAPLIIGQIVSNSVFASNFVPTPLVTDRAESGEQETAASDAIRIEPLSASQLYLNTLPTAAENRIKTAMQAPSVSDQVSALTGIPELQPAIQAAATMQNPGQILSPSLSGVYVDQDEQTGISSPLSQNQQPAKDVVQVAVTNPEPVLNLSSSPAESSVKQTEEKTDLLVPKQSSFQQQAIAAAIIPPIDASTMLPKGILGESSSSEAKVSQIVTGLSAVNNQLANAVPSIDSVSTVAAPTTDASIQTATGNQIVNTVSSVNPVFTASAPTSTTGIVLSNDTQGRSLSTVPSADIELDLESGMRLPGEILSLSDKNVLSHGVPSLSPSPNSSTANEPFSAIVTSSSDTQPQVTHLYSESGNEIPQVQQQIRSGVQNPAIGALGVATTEPELQVSKNSQTDEPPMNAPVEATQQVQAVLSKSTEHHKDADSLFSDSTAPIQHFTAPSGMDKQNELFLDNLQQATSPSNRQEIISQIVDRARVSLRSVEQSEMVMHLRPEHLGELTLKISLTNGLVSAVFHSDNPEVRQVIEASLPQLKQELSQQGIKLDNVGVFSGSDQFFDNGQRSPQQHPPVPIRKNPREFMQAIESTEIATMRATEGVDYRV